MYLCIVPERTKTVCYCNRNRTVTGTKQSLAEPKLCGRTKTVECLAVSSKIMMSQSNFKNIRYLRGL